MAPGIVEQINIAGSNDAALDLYSSESLVRINCIRAEDEKLLTE